MSQVAAAPSLPVLVLKETGERFFFQSSARESGGRFRFRWHLARGKVGPPAHRHLHETEHFQVHAGHLQVFMNGTCHDLHPGDALTVPAGTPHFFGHPGDEEAVVDVTLGASAMEDLLVPMAVAYPETQGPPLSALPRLMVHLARGIETGASVPVSPIGRSLITLLGAFFRLLGARPLPTATQWWQLRP